MREGVQIERLAAVSEAIAAIDVVLASEESGNEWEELTRMAAKVVSAADALSLTVLADPEPRTIAGTDELALALDAQQYAAGAGPCLTAARERQPIRLALSADQQQWPRFADAAREAGVRATLSVPLVIAAETRPNTALAGSLNVYSRSVPEFDVVDETLLSLFTGVASRAVSTARRYQQLHQTISQLEAALVSRSEIDQAKGALRVLNGGSAEEAFAVLVEKSQRQNVKIRDLARQVLDELSRGLAPAPTAGGPCKPDM